MKKNFVETFIYSQPKAAWGKKEVGFGIRQIWVWILVLLLNELYVLNLTELLLTICKMKWFPMPQAVLRTKWDVYKEPKCTSLDKLAFWTAAHTVMIAHTMSNSSTLIACCLLAPPFSSEDLGVCLRKTWPQLQGYFLVCLSQSLWSHCPGHDLDVGAWSNSAPMR